MATYEFEEIGKGVYAVHTDLPPETITAVGLEIAKLWAEYALGADTPGLKRIEHPTGRYASAIQFRKEGVATVSIVADENVAPEAAILETGHKPVDLKTKLQHGRRYPMHREGGRYTGMSAPVPLSSTGRNWVIPEMKAYTPARTFAKMAAAMLSA